MSDLNLTTLVTEVETLLASKDAALATANSTIAKLQAQVDQQAANQITPEERAALTDLKAKADAATAASVPPASPEPVTAPVEVTGDAGA